MPMVNEKNTTLNSQHSTSVKEIASDPRWEDSKVTYIYML